jgi:hypothetical protein
MEQVKIIEREGRLAWGLQEVAEVTGLSLAFLRLEVRSGRLQVRSFGRRKLVLAEELERYLAAGSAGASKVKE